MSETLFLVPGFTPDSDNPHTGVLSNEQGQSMRIYLRRSRSPERFATERAALTLLGNQPGGPPVPHLVAECSTGSTPVLVLSYEAGVNLADLLSPSSEAPPRPPWYVPVHLPGLPAAADLIPLLREIGQAVRAMHAIRVDAFGKLVGQEPNPYRWDARAFTRQEMAHRTRTGVEKGVLTPVMAQVIEQWCAQEINCLAETEPPCFVHFDLHAGNVRVFPDPSTGAWRLRALYDFEMARAWLPEWDLAPLHWDLKYLDGDTGQVWRSFLEGYGPVDPTRLRLFEALRALTAISYTDRYPEWGAWSLALLKKMIPFPCETKG